MHLHARHHHHYEVSSVGMLFHIALSMLWNSWIGVIDGRHEEILACWDYLFAIIDEDSPRHIEKLGYCIIG